MSSPPPSHWPAERPPFIAASVQLAAVVVLTALCAAAALLLPRRRPGTSPPAGAGTVLPLAAGVSSLVLASAFQLVEDAQRLPPALSVVLMLACWAIALTLLAVFTGRPACDPGCWSAVAAGTVLTYGWLSISDFVAGHSDAGGPTGPVDVTLQILLVLTVLGLVVWGARRRRPETF